MKTLVLLNAAAGSAGSPDAARARVEQALAAQGLEAEVRSAAPDQLTPTAARAVQAGIDIVAGAGGDGTLNSVAAALVDTRTALGVLPLGTLNHFAQDLKLPLDLPSAAAVLAHGAMGQVDVGEVNGHIFLNNSSIGIYPLMVRDREYQRLRFGRSKGTAMLVAAMRLLRRFPLIKVRLEVEGRPLVRTTPFVFVGNNTYEINLFRLGARERLDRGQLCLYTANCTSRLAMLRLSLRAVLGRLDQAADFDALCVPKLTVESRRRKLSVAFDGEVRTLPPPLAYRIRPRALRVMLPPVTAGAMPTS